jgi:hypothetical protein
MRQLEGLELLLDQPGRSLQVLRGHPRRVSPAWTIGFISRTKRLYTLFLYLQPPAQGHPTRCPNQLDRQPRPQAQGGSWSHRRGKEEQGSRKGPQAQPQLRHLEEAQHPLPPTIPLNVSHGLALSMGFWNRLSLVITRITRRADGKGGRYDGAGVGSGWIGCLLYA